MITTMKKVELSSYGEPENLQLVTAPIPQPKAGEVLLKVEAAGVNYADTLRRRNLYFQPTPLPYTLGNEAVGIIVMIGDGVEPPYTNGARVLAILPSSGGYAEYVVAPAQYCVPLPPHMDSKVATAIFVQGTTARLLTSAVSNNLQGKTVLVTAAGGGVGSLVVQLATMQGATVIAAASTEQKLSFAKSLGAVEVIDYTVPGWSAKVKELTGDKGVDVVFETVGGAVYSESVKSLRTGGHLIIYGCASGVQGSVNPEYFVDEALTQSGFNLAYYIQQKTEVWQAALGEVIGLVTAEKLKVEVSEIFPLAQAAAAHRRLEERQTKGKVVLVP